MQLDSKEEHIESFHNCRNKIFRMLPTFNW